jgi:hypothetical protein
MKNIMVTDFLSEELDEEENVCFFTEKMTLDQVQKVMESKSNISYSEIFEVSNEDLQFYVYEPIWD